MKNGLMIAAAAAASYFLFKKLAQAAPSSGGGMMDTSGRSIQLTEKNGYLRDQFGGLWI